MHNSYLYNYSNTIFSHATYTDVQFFRRSPILPFATGIGYISSITGGCQFTICNSIWVVFLYHSFRIQRWVSLTSFCLCYTVVRNFITRVVVSTHMRLLLYYCENEPPNQSTSISVQYWSIPISNSSNISNLRCQFCWISFWSWVECVTDSCIHILWELSLLLQSSHWRIGGRVCGKCTPVWAHKCISLAEIVGGSNRLLIVRNFRSKLQASINYKQLLTVSVEHYIDFN